MADHTVGLRRVRLWLRPLSWLVLAGFGLLAALAAAGSARLVAEQESRLLTERTAEIGALLSAGLGPSAQSSLTTLATTAQHEPARFDERARAARRAGKTIGAIAWLQQRDGGWTVTRSVGQGLPVGSALTGEVLALVRSATTGLQAAVVPVSGKPRLALVLGPPVTAPGTAIYEDAVLHPATPTPLTDSQPFHELALALYAAPRAEQSRLVLTTSTLPLRGRTASSPVAIGQSHWLVVAAARQSLAGPWTRSVPWLLGCMVVLLGLAMTAVVESVSRRRDYALGLVAERTEELRHSLTQLQEAQQAVIATERLAALGEMAATVGHELRNPLAVLMNSLYLIRTAVAKVPDLLERTGRHLDTADREVAAATLIVSDLLEFSRPRTAAPVPMEVGDLLAEAVAVAPPPTGIDVERSGDDLPPIMADRAQLRQVVLNLLTNAYEAMPGGGHAWIDARQVGDGIEVQVSDTGVGLDEAIREQVFEPFVSSKIKGTGLGLAVSKRIVEAHAGTLTLHSRPGGGCTAVIHLPLEPAGTTELDAGTPAGAGAGR